MPNLTPLVSDEYVGLGAASGQERLHTSHLTPLPAPCSIPFFTASRACCRVSAKSLTGMLETSTTRTMNAYVNPYFIHVRLPGFTANARMTSRGNRMWTKSWGPTVRNYMLVSYWGRAQKLAPQVSARPPRHPPSLASFLPQPQPRHHYNTSAFCALSFFTLSHYKYTSTTSTRHDGAGSRPRCVPGAIRQHQ